jgi:hypothetical protein
MAESDPLIERTEEAGAGSREAQAANLFDLRRIIGFVFLAWGILLTVLGITESDAEIAKAADVNINLAAGLCMLGISAIFLVWAFTRPLGEELADDGSQQGGGRPGDDSPGGGGSADAGLD